MRLVLLLLFLCGSALGNAEDYEVIDGGDFFFSPASMSHDGRFIVYEKLVNSPDDVEFEENARYIYLYDRETKERVWINKTFDGLPPNQFKGYSHSTISGDGSIVVFSSASTNLIPKNTIIRSDIFIYNRLSKELSCLTCDIPEDDTITDQYCCPDVSFDGESVVFSTRGGIRFHDLEHNNSWIVAATPPPRTDDIFFERTIPFRQISGNGKYLFYATQAPELPLFKDTSEHVACYRADIYSGETIRVSGPDINLKRFNQCNDGRISNDGNTVFYLARADAKFATYFSWFSRDIEKGKSNWITRKPDGEKVALRDEFDPSTISDDGRFVAINNPMIFMAKSSEYKKSLLKFPEQCWIYDTMTNKVRNLHTNSKGKATQVACYRPSISGDGKWVTFLGGAKDENTPLSFGPYFHLILKRNQPSSSKVSLSRPKASVKKRSLRIRLQELDNVVSYLVELYKGKELVDSKIVTNERAKFKRLKSGTYKVKYSVHEWVVAPSQTSLESKFKKVKIR